MRTPTSHTGRDGVTRHKVRFRHRGRQTSEVFTDPNEATRFATLLEHLGPEQALAQIGAVDRPADELTLDAYAADYIDGLTDITEGTRNRYRSIHTRDWSPHLGDHLLSAITRLQIAAVINAWADQGVADKTIANKHGFLAGLLNSAILDGHLQASPCRGIRLPRRTEHETEDMVLLTHDEFQLLLAQIPDHYRPLVTTLVGTGARWGEAEALPVRDVTLSGPRPSARIRSAAKWDSTRSVKEIGPTKTKKSRRTIDLPEQVVDALRPLMVGRPPAGRVFLAPRGGHLRHRTFWSDIWRPAVWRAQHCADHLQVGCRCGTAHPERCRLHTTPPPPCGCPGTLPSAPRIHDLRHTHASWLLAAGVPIHVVQARLGHESITTTVDTYGHLLPDAQAQAAAAAAVALSPSGVTPTVLRSVGP